MSKLYQLLNKVSVNTEKYGEQKLSEPETKRIKNKVLREIRNREKQNKTKWTPLLKACACTVLVLGVGGAGIAAARGQLPQEIKKLFGVHSEKEIQTANHMGKSVHVTAKDAGIKITAEGVMRDARHVGIVYKIEKSDGSTLAKNGLKCTGAEFEESDCKSDTGTLWTSGSEDCFAQEENRYSIKYYTIFNYGEKIGKNLLVTLSGLRLRFENNQTFYVDMEGNWSFRITADCKDSSVDFAQGQEIQVGKEKAKLKEFSVSPMGYYFEISSKEKFNGNKLIKAIDGNVSLYLKNGDKITLDGSSAPVLREDGTWSFVIVGTFDKLILTDDLDKVVIGKYKWKYDTESNQLK